MTTIDIPLAVALELLQADDKTVVLHAEAPGIEIRIPYTCTLEDRAGPPPMLSPPGPDDEAEVAGGHVCPQCGKTAKTAAGLSIHIGRTHGKPKTTKPYKAPDVEHVCEHCGLEFKSAQGLGAHRGRMHKTIEPQEQPPADVTPIERGRECVEPGCTTRLSTYNKADKCGVHDSLIQPPKFMQAQA